VRAAYSAWLNKEYRGVDPDVPVELMRSRLDDSTRAALCRSSSWTGQAEATTSGRSETAANIHNYERTRAFVERYGPRQMDLIDDVVVAEWLAGGKRNGTIPALRAMFNDAASAKGGRLVRRNPFARLGISRGPAADTSSRRARSRFGRSFAAHVSWRARRLLRGCRSPRSPGYGPASLTLCAA
jgi:hypothetical protein